VVPRALQNLHVGFGLDRIVIASIRSTYFLDQIGREDKPAALQLFLRKFIGRPSRNKLAGK
jgi:hypothetical protein